MFYEAPSHIISAFSFSGWRLRVQVTSSSPCPSNEGRPGATLFDEYSSLRNSRAPLAYLWQASEKFICRKNEKLLDKQQIGYNTSLEALYKLFERWQQTCHSLHSSLLLSALDALYKPLEENCCIFSLKKH